MKPYLLFHLSRSNITAHRDKHGCDGDQQNTQPNNHANKIKIIKGLSDDANSKEAVKAPLKREVKSH